jgi:hypothetical protein
MTITARDRQEWAHHPVTQEFLLSLQEARQGTMEAWAQERYTADRGELTLQANAKALGGIGVLDQILDLIEGYKASAEAEADAANQRALARSN